MSGEASKISPIPEKVPTQIEQSNSESSPKEGLESRSISTIGSLDSNNGGFVSYVDHRPKGLS